MSQDNRLKVVIIGKTSFLIRWATGYFDFYIPNVFSNIFSSDSNSYSVNGQSFTMEMWDTGMIILESVNWLADKKSAILLLTHSFFSENQLFSTQI